MKATFAPLPAVGFLALSIALAAPASALEGQKALQEAAARHAAAHGVPMSLVHRVIMRESRYNPRAVSKGNYGLMQIRLGTAKGMGYRGPASGLLDAETNLTYAIPYLANAWKLSGGNETRAVQLYASGYYFVAKRKGMLGEMRTAHSAPRRGRPLVTAAAPATPPAATAALASPADREAGSPAALAAPPVAALEPQVVQAAEKPEAPAAVATPRNVPLPPARPRDLTVMAGLIPTQQPAEQPSGAEKAKADAQDAKAGETSVARSALAAVPEPVRLPGQVATIGAPVAPVTANATRSPALGFAPAPPKPKSPFGTLFRDLTFLPD